VPAPTQIGVCVMVHGDNKGLVLPPRVAPVQVIIVWILSNSDPADVIAAVTETATQIERSLKAAGVRVKLDDRDNYLPGWKYAHWEQKVRWWLGLVALVGAGVTCLFGLGSLHRRACRYELKLARRTLPSHR
jgi:hypothetical protein